MTGALVVITPEQLEQLIREAVRAELGDREPPSEWLDTTAAAELLGRHPKTVARMAKAGELAATRLGHQWRFRRSDLETFLAGGTE